MKNPFAAALVEYWSQMKGTVHPDDEPFCACAPAELNFDFPPPAFTGDITNASIIVLMANGGYNAVSTPAEFTSPDAEELWRSALRSPRPSTSKWTSPYYLRGRLGVWLTSGRAAVVNALAYRSEKVTGGVRRFADALPSTQFHRMWLRGPLLEAANAGMVRVVIHRSGLWQVTEEVRASTRVRVLAGSEPARRYLSAEVATWAEGPST